MSDTDKTETLLEESKRFYKEWSAAWASQRERENEDLRYQVPELQWDEAAKRERMAKDGRPARPMLSISKQDQPIQLVLNQARSAQLGVNIHPVSAEADDDTAEVIQDLYRRIERDSNASQARMWALDRASKAGIGAYRIVTRWDEDSPETFDQEIGIERILDQSSVVFDPAAQKTDFSDGEGVFVAGRIRTKTFKRLFPGAKVPTAEDLAGDESAPLWLQEESDDVGVLVAERFYKVHDPETIDIGGRKRERDKVTVKWCKFTALEILEEEVWNGTLLPIIPVIGKELQPFDSDRRWQGMVRPTRDAQKFHNYAASSLVERMAMEPKIPFIGYEGQFTDPGWQEVNTRNLTHLEVPPKPDAAGGTLPLPQRAQLDQTGMSLAMQGLQVSNDWIQSSTGIYDPSLGKVGREKSGRQVMALQSQADDGNNHYLANLADITLPYEARVILDLIPTIYDRPGRVTRILGGEDEIRPVMLNAPFTMNRAGLPVRAPEGQQGAKVYNLRGGYSVSISVGKSYQTKMQEGQEEIGAILQADPSLMPLIGSVYFRYRDSPGSKEIAEILKEVRDKQFPGLGQDKDQGPSPEQLQAQMQAMQAQGQQMQQQLQMAIEQIKTDQAKQQAMIEKARIDAEKDIQLQRMRDATSIAVATINARAKGVLSDDEARHEQVALAEEHAFEANQSEKDRDHDRQLAEFDAAHEVGMAAAGGNTMKRTREGGQEQDSEQGQETSQGRSRQPQEQADGASE